MKVPTTIWTRKEWTKRRDKAKVPSGACKKVAVGPELDKFHKTNDGGKDIMKTFAQADALKSKLNQYCAEIKKKHEKWEKEVRGTLIKSADDFLKVRTDIAKANSSIPAFQAAAKKSWKSIKPEADAWIKDGNQGGLKNAETEVLKKVLMDLYYVHTTLAAIDPNLKKKAAVYGTIADKLGSDGVNVAIGKALVSVLE